MHKFSRSKDTYARVQIGNTGLDYVQQSCPEFGSLVLELLDNVLGQVLLQKRVALLRFLELLVS